MVILKKILNWDILARQYLLIITLDPLQGFFLKFCIIKGAKRCMKIILMVFPKRNLLGEMGCFGPENVVTS